MEKPEEKIEEVEEEFKLDKSKLGEAKLATKEKIEEVKEVVKEVVKEEIKPKIEEVVEKVEKKIEKKNVTREDKIIKLTDELYKEAKDSDKIFITMIDKSRNYWNSADGLQLIIVQGRCKELPEDMTEVLKHALSEDNKLLREADDMELREEMKIRATEHLINIGEISAKPSKKEDKLKL